MTSSGRREVIKWSSLMVNGTLLSVVMVTDHKGDADD